MILYCQKCGCVTTSNYKKNTCSNLLCDNDAVYELDENFAELIINLHTLGIPTRMCCSGHLNSTDMYVIFDSENLVDSQIHEIVSKLNNLCVEEMYYQVVTVLDRHRKMSPCIKLRRHPSGDDRPTTLELLKRQVVFYDMMGLIEIQALLRSLTPTDIKETYGRYILKTHLKDI